MEHGSVTALDDAVAAEKARLQAARLAQFKRYSIELCDSSWHPQGLLRGWDSLQFVDRYCDVGTGAVNAPASDFNRSLVSRGCTVLVRNAGVVEQAGVVDWGESSGDSIVLKINWKSPLVYLADRVCYPDPLHPAGSQTKATDDQTGFTTSAILHYVNANAGPQALPERRVGGLGVGVGITADIGGGLVLDAPVQARFDNLLELCRRLAVSGGVAFEIVTTDRDHRLVAYQVSDLSSTVVFSNALRNMGAGDAALKPPTGTAAIVLGDGEGLAQSIVEVASADGAAWNRRIEVVVTGKGETAVMADIGRRALAEKSETLEATFEAIAGAHEQAIRLGDLVTVVPWPGESAVKPIREKKTTVSASGGRRVTFVAGDYQATSGTQSQAQMREFQRRLQLLERR